MTLRYEILPVTPFRQNCTLIWDDESGEAVLTDVGGDVPFLLQALANRKLTLTAIWLTHGHLDHAGGVVEMLETHKVPVLARTAKMNSCSNRCRKPPRNTDSPSRPPLRRTVGSKKAKRSRSDAMPSKCCIFRGTRPDTWFSIVPKRSC